MLELTAGGKRFLVFSDKVFRRTDCLHIVPGFRNLPALFLLSAVFSAAVAQNENPVAEPATTAGNQEEIVDFPSTFFTRYRPESALDMVQQLPGFQLDDGDDLRGFGGAAGNILINGRRPTAKQDVPSQILTRIPAGHVDRIELIRGQVDGIDLRGQIVVANVILNSDLPATVRWSTFARYNFEIEPPLTVEWRMSLSDRWSDIDYNAGFYLQRNSNGDPGTEIVLDADGARIEDRLEGNLDEGPRGGANLNASTWLGNNLVQFNSNVYLQEEDSERFSLRTPLVPGQETSDKIIDIDTRLLQVELGTDAERFLTPQLIGKAIALYFYQNRDALESERNLNAADELFLLREADTKTRSTEGILRAEFNWVGWRNHSVQATVELALNVLDNTLLQTEDSGGGPVPVVVPGANTRVEETRGEVLLKDTWSRGILELDYGIGAEISEITQRGDAEQSRDFFFLKPQALLTHSPSRREQSRLRLAREVAQLDFSDFVSAAVFLDDDLALGNPDLKPETTWVAEASHERRFGDLGVITVTVFHHWISDVQDLLPITTTFEAPGNIGDGRRWGTEIETTVPMDWLRLKGGRFDLRARWQDSTVTDPVTGEKRVLSAAPSFGTSPSFRNENEWAVDLRFRQDFEADRWAWGWHVRSRAERPVFKVDEFDLYDEGTDVNIFVETTRWWNTKIRLEGLNVLNHIETRDRSVFAAERDLSPLSFRELTEAYNGARILLSLSGTF